MKKKLLIILPNLPYPMSVGGNQAMYNGIISIKDDYDVHLVYLQSHSSKKQSIPCIPGVTISPFRYKRKIDQLGLFIWITTKCAQFLKLGSMYADYFFELIPTRFKPACQEYIDFINNYIKKYKIDVVQFEMLSCLSHVITLPQEVKKIFVHHELGFVVNEQKLLSKGYLENRKANVELAKILELGLLDKCDAILTLSECDKQKLVREGVKAPIYSSFAIVNTDVKSYNTNENGNVLSFVGPSLHTPNYLGIKWFLENCWDKLLRYDASYRLKIIGKWSEDRCNEFMRKFKNIEFVGFVPNLADALNNTIMIVPITVGSGIRMKILEAASLGIPFVCTTVGAEGLPFENGRDCFKADTPENFVKAIVDLKDKSLREKFAQNANAIVKEKYSMDALRKNRLEIYEKVLNEKNENL